MKFIRKLFISVSLCAVLGGGLFVYNRLTDGFNLHQIESSIPSDARFDVQPLSQEEKENIEKILGSPFYYIGKGCQFYVFENQEEKVVIKLLKQKHLRSFSWLKKIPGPTNVSSYFKEKVERREKRVQSLFESCKLAYEELKEETGLIYVHLNRKPIFGKKITLIDKLGLKHQIAVDDYEFILQKKAISVSEVFEKTDLAEIPHKVEKLAELVVQRCQNGIRDRDRSFVQNVAFCEGENRAVFVDIGQFYKEETILSDEEQKLDLIKRMANLLDWTQRKFPNYLPLVETAVQEITR